MIDAPGEVDPKQLEELHLKIVDKAKPESSYPQITQITQMSGRKMLFDGHLTFGR